MIIDALEIKLTFKVFSLDLGLVLLNCLQTRFFFFLLLFLLMKSGGRGSGHSDQYPREHSFILPDYILSSKCN